MTVKAIAAAMMVMLVSALGAQSSRAGQTSYHFKELAGGANVTSRAFSNPDRTQRQAPLTFDFTVADALAPNMHYTFGAGALLGRGQAGSSGDVLDFAFSDGTPLTSFAMKDYPAVRDGYRGGPAASDTVRIGLTIDASGAIAYYDILLDGPSKTDPTDVLFLQLQHDPGPSAGAAIVEAAYDYGGYGGSYRFVDGDLHCDHGCGFAITSTPGGLGDAGAPGGVVAAAPEPASWALLLVGVGGLGVVLRRHRRRCAPLSLQGGLS